MIVMHNYKREWPAQVTSGWHFQIAIGNMVTPTTIDRIMPIGTTAMTTDSRLILNEMDITGKAGTV